MVIGQTNLTGVQEGTERHIYYTDLLREGLLYADLIAGVPAAIEKCSVVATAPDRG